MKRIALSFTGKEPPLIIDTKNETLPSGYLFADNPRTKKSK